MLHNTSIVACLAQVNDAPVSEGIWRTITEGMYAQYCQSQSDNLMFADQSNDKMAITKDMLLTAGDIIQFRVRWHRFLLPGAQSVEITERSHCSMFDVHSANLICVLPHLAVFCKNYSVLCRVFVQHSAE